MSYPIYPTWLWVCAWALEKRGKKKGGGEEFYSAHLIHDHFCIFRCKLYFAWELCSFAYISSSIYTLNEYNYLVLCLMMHHRDKTAAHADISELVLG